MLVGSNTNNEKTLGASTKNHPVASLASETVNNEDLLEGQQELIDSYTPDELADMTETYFEDVKQDISEDEVEAYLDMDQDEIQDEFHRMNEQYEVGEELSKEDLDFLIMDIERVKSEGDFEKDYTEDLNEIYEEETNDSFENETTLTNASEEKIKAEFVGTKNSGLRIVVGPKKYSTQVELDSKISNTVPIGGGKHVYRSISQSYALSGKSNIKTIKMTTYHNAYGLLSVGGGSVKVGKTYSGNVNSGARASGWSMDLSKQYSAVLTVRTNNYTTCTVNAKNGVYNFKINDVNWTW